MACCRCDFATRQTTNLAVMIADKRCLLTTFTDDQRGQCMASAQCGLNLPIHKLKMLACTNCANALNTGKFVSICLNSMPCCVKFVGNRRCDDQSVTGMIGACWISARVCLASGILIVDWDKRRCRDMSHWDLKLADQLRFVNWTSSSSLCCTFRLGRNKNP